MCLPFFSWMCLIYDSKIDMRCSAIVNVTFTAFALAFTTCTLRTTTLVGSWRGESFPVSAHDTELHVARGFNSKYCEEQRAYLCGRASLDSLLAMDFGGAFVSNTTASDSKAVVMSLERYGLSTTAAPRVWAQMCAYCADSKSSDKFDEFLTWTADHCEFTGESINWCEKTNDTQLTLGNGDLALEFEGSPYARCRTAYLDDTHYWTLTVGCIFLGIFATFVLMLWNLYVVYQQSQPVSQVPMIPAVATPVSETTNYNYMASVGVSKKTERPRGSEADNGSTRSTVLSSSSVSSSD